jgi:hypothetical protein
MVALLAVAVAVAVAVNVADRALPMRMGEK